MRDMLGRGRAVSVGEALRLILESISQTNIPHVKVPLVEAFGRVLAGDIVSPEDLPGFSRSTVDGYAVSSKDTFGASETSPVYLNVINEIVMGHEPGFELKKGETAKIATGGMLPGGADAAVMFEHVQVLDERMVEIQKAVAPGDNIIQRGEDVRAGELILGKGRRLRAHDVAVLAGAGFSEVDIFESPTVSIISTGDEVVSEGKTVKPGQVRDMNSLILTGLLIEDGALPFRKGIVRDSLDALKSVVERSLKESDMVLITGGSSVGVKDMTESAISEVGKVLFHSVSMKPGKPMLAGISGGKPVLGLPGHPRAVAVCYEVFIRPLVERLSGLSSETMADMRRTVKARLAKSVSSVLGRQEVISVALKDRGGELWAEPALGKSGLLSMMVRADGTITVPAGKPGLQKGQPVDVKLI
jgi:molybdopterin molybdotransferase